MLAGGAQLRAGGEHDDARPRSCRDPPGTEGGQERDLARTDDRPGRDHRVPGGDVLPASADVGAVRERRADGHARVAAVGLLERHDGVGPAWERGPRHDLDRGARGDGERLAGPGVHLADDRQRDRLALGGAVDVEGLDGVAVHGGVVEAREVRRRHEVLVQRQAERLDDRLVVGRERSDAPQNRLQVVLDGEDPLRDALGPVPRTRAPRRGGCPVIGGGGGRLRGSVFVR